MLFKNKTEKGIMVRLDDKTEKTGYSWKTVKPNKEIELREEIGKSHGFEPVEKKKEETLDTGNIEEKKDKEGKFSKTDLIDLTKLEQVKILKDLKVSDKEIKKLKTETRRVAKILKLQNAKNNK